jgi:hypothetical protein
MAQRPFFSEEEIKATKRMTPKKTVLSLILDEYGFCSSETKQNKRKDP